MPKIKTKSGAKKRFKITGSGKVLSAHAGKRHGMIKRTTKQIRDHRGHSRSVQDRRRQHQEILPAQRLIAKDQSPISAANNRTTRQEISHGTRQARRHLARQAQESLQGGEGLLRPPQEHDPHRQAGGGEGKPIRLSRPQAQKAHVPGIVDPAAQRRGAARSASTTAGSSPASARRACSSTARCFPISPSPSRRHSRRSWKRPRPRCRLKSFRQAYPRPIDPRGNWLRGNGITMSDIANLEQELLSTIAAAGDEAAIEAVRVAALGKNGSVTALLKTSRAA